jgi:hypothetical protein
MHQSPKYPSQTATFKASPMLVEAIASQEYHNSKDTYIVSDTLKTMTHSATNLMQVLNQLSSNTNEILDSK